MIERPPAVKQGAAQATPTSSVTSALLLMAARHHAQNQEWLNALGREERGGDHKTLEGRIESALSLVTLVIVSDAMREALGETVAFQVKASMPGEPLPPNAHLLVAFAFAVVGALAIRLQSEGSRPQLDILKPCARVVDALFILRSTEEKKKLFMMGTQAHAIVMRSGAPNVLTWFSNLTDLVILYLLDDETLKARGFPLMFGSSLKSLLAAGN